MLSISAMSGAGQGQYYVRLALDDYYARGEDVAGQWFGRGTRALGLEGTVDPTAFRHLLEGRSPDGTRDLVQNAGRADRCVGWDATFSAPKPVGILYGLLPHSESEQILGSHRAAIRVALEWIESRAGETRRGSGGREREPVGLCLAVFEHETSRAMDPALHSHCLIMNVGIREDGTTGAIRSRSIYQLKMEAGAMYRRALARELESRGLRVEMKAGDRLHVPGVPDSLVKAMSKRRATIERVMAERGYHTAKAAKVVALDTRPKKQAISREELRTAWQTTAREHGFTREHALALFPKRERTHERARERETKEEPVSAVTDGATPASPAGLGRSPAERMFAERKRGLALPSWFWRGSAQLFRVRRLGISLRLERRRLFPRAPWWSPASRVVLPRLVLRSDRDLLGQPPRQTFRIASRTGLGPLEVQVRESRLFPNAPSWSPVGRLKKRTLALAARRPRPEPDWARGYRNGWETARAMEQPRKRPFDLAR